MSRLIRFTFCFSIFLLPFPSNAQQRSDRDSVEQRILQVAKEIMQEAKTCALLTQDEEGRARIRTMSPFLPDENFVVWFGTNPLSRKVKQIENDPRVSLYYTNKDDTGYVMISGRAELINDPEEKEVHWKKEWEAFYPNRGEAYLLIKVSPEWIEVISEPHGILGDEKTWQPHIIRFE